jgi:hypothetical protein
MLPNQQFVHLEEVVIRLTSPLIYLAPDTSGTVKRRMNSEIDYATTTGFAVAPSKTREQIEVEMSAHVTLPATDTHKEILRICARANTDEASRERLRTLVSGESNLAEVLAAAADHGVAPLLCYHLTRIAGEELPPPWRERLNDEFRRNSRRNLFLTAELYRVLDAFERPGIPAIPHKGPALAVMAFGDTALRQFADLDLVLRQSDIPAAHKVMLDLGYQSEIPWKGGPDPRKIPGHYAYRGANGLANVELHTPATMRYLPTALPLEALLMRLERVELSDGRAISAFSAEDALPLLCVHGAKHRWDQLSWIADISELIRSDKNFCWDRCQEFSRELGATRMVNLGLAVAQRLLETPLPEPIWHRVQQDVVATELCRQITKQFLSGSRIGPKPAARFWTRVQMRGGGISGLAYAARLVTLPTEDDWGEIALPPILAPLYAILRPLRLFLRRDRAM